MSDTQNRNTPDTPELPVAEHKTKARIISDGVVHFFSTLIHRVSDFFKNLDKLVLGISLGVVAIMAIVVIIINLFVVMSTSAYFVFINGKQLGLITSDSNWSNTYIISKNSDESTVSSVKVSKGGGSALYPRNTENGIYELWFGYIEGMDDNGRQVAKNVRRFTASDDLENLCYLDADGNLYIGSLTGLAAVADKVSEFYTDTRCESAVYMRESKLYRYSDGKNSYLASASSIDRVSTDLKEVLFIDSKGALCYKKQNEKTKMLSADIRGIKSYRCDSVYYITNEQNGSCTLFYFNGERVSRVLDNVTVNVSSGSNAAAVCKGVDADGNSMIWLTCADRVKKINVDYSLVADAQFTASSGRFLYVVKGKNDRSTLYCVNLSEKEIGDPVVIDSDVDVIGAVDHSSDTKGYDAYYYFKNVKDGFGELRINGVKASDKANVHIDVESLCSNKCYLFNTDMEENKTINIMRDGKVKTVAKNVYDYKIIHSKYVAFITDYNQSKNCGKLSVYDLEKFYKISPGATGIFSKC